MLGCSGVVCSGAERYDGDRIDGVVLWWTTSADGGRSDEILPPLRSVVWLAVIHGLLPVPTYRT